eukprot:TRINITY_DN821_c3_g2_i1.p1 TRINITY_DN821_c3_g2~~TRINITY_DN821_c3_g2_i1.p1  ORF type:complete len:150 (+),score=22.84 TRINITY_DN821_c3_g2_i1:50-499(+)
MGFSAVFLDDESKEKLKGWAKEEIGRPVGRIFGEHMTIEHKGSDASVETVDGENVVLEVIGYGFDKRCQAAVVSCPGQGSVNKVKHITLSCNGVAPSYSNSLLDRHITPVVNGPLLFGTVNRTSPKISQAERDSLAAAHAAEKLENLAL